MSQEPKVVYTPPPVPAPAKSAAEDYASASAEALLFFLCCADSEPPQFEPKVDFNKYASDDEEDEPSK